MYLGLDLSLASVKLVLILGIFFPEKNQFWLIASALCLFPFGVSLVPF
jgi:hypothetical protein